MTIWPFAVAGEFRRSPTDGVDPITVSRDSHPIVPETLDGWKRSGGQCRLCHAGCESVWHLMADCTHAHVVEQRDRFYSSGRDIMERICAELEDAYERAGMVVLPGFDTAVVQMRMHADALTSATLDGRYVMYRLLLCAPFSAFDVRRPIAGGVRAAHGQREDNGVAMPLSHAFGSLLDNTVLPRRFLRRCANIWTS